MSGRKEHLFKPAWQNSFLFSTPTQLDKNCNLKSNEQLYSERWCVSDADKQLFVSFKAAPSFIVT